MIRPFRLLLSVLLLPGVVPFALAAQTPSPPPAASTVGPANPGQAELVSEVAAATGKSPAALNALLDGAVVKQSILDAISRPAE